RLYRKMRYGDHLKRNAPQGKMPAMEMHGTPREEVVGFLEQHGGMVLSVRPYQSAGNWISYRCYVTMPLGFSRRVDSPHSEEHPFQAGFISPERISALSGMQTVTQRTSKPTIHAADAHFQTLFDEAPLGVCLVDADFRICMVNPIARPFFAPIPDLIGRD